jgi:hypothetical protein
MHSQGVPAEAHARAMGRLLIITLSLAAFACGPRGPSHRDMYAAVDPACGRQCQQIEATCDAGCGHDGTCWSAHCYPAEGRCLNSCPIVNHAAVAQYEHQAFPMPDGDLAGDCDVLHPQDLRVKIAGKWLANGRISNREFLRCEALP